MTYQRNFAGVGRNVGTHARVVHSVKADAALDVLQTMLCGCGRDFVVYGRCDKIGGAGVENDVGWQGQVAN